MTRETSRTPWALSGEVPIGLAAERMGKYGSNRAEDRSSADTLELLFAELLAAAEVLDPVPPEAMGPAREVLLRARDYVDDYHHARRREHDAERAQQNAETAEDRPRPKTAYLHVWVNPETTPPSLRDFAIHGEPDPETFDGGIWALVASARGENYEDAKRQLRKLAVKLSPALAKLRWT